MPRWSQSTRAGTWSISSSEAASPPLSSQTTLSSPCSPRCARLIQHILLSQSRFTNVYEEQLLFGPSSMGAEGGGILGLFLGISFMTRWNGLAWVVDNSRAVKAWSTGGHLED